MLAMHDQGWLTVRAAWKRVFLDSGSSRIVSWPVTPILGGTWWPTILGLDGTSQLAMSKLITLDLSPGSCYGWSPHRLDPSWQLVQHHKLQGLEDAAGMLSKARTRPGVDGKARHSIMAYNVFHQVQVSFGLCSPHQNPLSQLWACKSKCSIGTGRIHQR